VITTGENIVDASSSMDENNQPSVSIVLDSSGGRSMLDTTKEFLGYRMAVVFIENQVETVMEDGVAVKKRSKTQDIINAATIQGTFSNRFQITGLDSAREATNLALLLRAGSLSAPVEIIEERTIGPSLSADFYGMALPSFWTGCKFSFDTQLSYHYLYFVTDSGDTHTPWNSRNCADCGYGS
jgi:preprotein translocase subunit SecD